ncbi:MAG TPA: hypothetical protein VFQ59_02735 [Candidatus Paceibacterota bacterium]|nr:hypothetical protein [Candidatus Paceibacterota bacterium]
MLLYKKVISQKKEKKMETRFNLLIQPVMSERIRVPAIKTIALEDSWGFFNDNKIIIPLPKPFIVLLDDKELMPHNQKTLFVSYKHFLDGKVIILKTTSDKFIVLTQGCKYGKYELFSTGGNEIFDLITQLYTSDGAFSKHFVFSCNSIGFCSGRKEMYIHKIGEYTDRNSLQDERVRGIDPHPTPFFPCEPESRFNIVEILGPFPNKEGRWWLAICSDQVYRVFKYSISREKLRHFEWSLNSDGKIATFRRVMPTLQPNYFYLLTTEGEELVVKADENSYFQPIPVSEENHPIAENCVGQYHDDTPTIFWSQAQSLRGFGGNLKQVSSLLASWDNKISW